MGLKTQFEIETMQINRESLKELVEELQEVNSHLFFNNVIKCYEIGAIDKEELKEQYTHYKNRWGI